MTFRLAEDEIEQLQLAAAQAGVSVGAFVRGTALAEIQRQQRRNVRQVDTPPHNPLEHINESTQARTQP